MILSAKFKSTTYRYPNARINLSKRLNYQLQYISFYIEFKLTRIYFQLIVEGDKRIGSRY